MAFYPIELNSTDILAEQGLFQDEFTELLSCRQVTVLPPFLDYSLLSQSRAPKVMFQAANEVLLSRRSVYNGQRRWLIVPLIQGGTVLGLLHAEGVGRRWADPKLQGLLERLGRLCLEKLLAEKRACRDAETLLWRRQALVEELIGAIDVAENGGTPAPRRLLDEILRAPRFSLICFLLRPGPEPWAGAGEFWRQRGPQIAELLPRGAMAAHLGGGYLMVYWPQTRETEIQGWTERLLHTLLQGERSHGSQLESCSLAAGSVSFPDDFYDDGPFLAWQRTRAADGAMAAAQAVRRAVVAAELAWRQKNSKVATYSYLRKAGLIPGGGEAIEKRFGSTFADDEPGALLLVKLDGWDEWQRKLGAKAAGRRAREIIELSRSRSPERVTPVWVGPDRFAIFLPGLDANAAQKLAEGIRGQVREKLDSTVSIGLSVHPCPGFSKEEILENAAKALVHAGFLGPGSQVLFDAVSLNIHGDRLYEAGRIEEAVEEFRRALSLDPGNVNVRNSLGVCYAQMGRFGEAAEEFTRVAAVAPDDFMVQYNLGVAQLSLGRRLEAESTLKRAAELEPSNAAVWAQLGKLYREQQRPEEALRHLQRALRLKPGWARAWRQLGEIHLELGALGEAAEVFKKALRLNSNDAAALSGLAMAYGKGKTNREIALSLARRSAELEPDNSLYLLRLAEMLWENGQTEEALEQCQRAALLAPDDGQIRRLHRRLAAASKQRGEDGPS